MISVHVYINNKNKGDKLKNSNVNMAYYLHFWHISDLIAFCIKSSVMKILNDYNIIIKEHNYWILALDSTLISTATVTNAQIFFILDKMWSIMISGMSSADDFNVSNIKEFSLAIWGTFFDLINIINIVSQLISNTLKVITQCVFNYDTHKVKSYYSVDVY